MGDVPAIKPVIVLILVLVFMVILLLFIWRLSSATFG